MTTWGSGGAAGVWAAPHALRTRARAVSSSTGRAKVRLVFIGLHSFASICGDLSGWCGIWLRAITPFPGGSRLRGERLSPRA
ncbi:MAG: hypothetical protein OHK0015_52450 [Chloroflexi bacterium OHK40]